MTRSLVLLLVAGGCVRGMNIRATVTSPVAAPVAGATVAMDCPQVFGRRGVSRIGTSDARGEVDHRESSWGRWISDGCDLVVGKDGFDPQIGGDAALFVFIAAPIMEEMIDCLDMPGDCETRKACVVSVAQAHDIDL